MCPGWTREGAELPPTHAHSHIHTHHIHTLTHTPPSSHAHTHSLTFTLTPPVAQNSQAHTDPHRGAEKETLLVNPEQLVGKGLRAWPEG